MSRRGGRLYQRASYEIHSGFIEVMLVQPPICCSNFFIHRFNAPFVMGQPVVSLEALVQMLLI